MSRLFFKVFVFIAALFCIGVFLKENLLQTVFAYPSGFQESIAASGLNSPVAMDISPDGRIFVTEKGGTLRIIKNGTLLSTPFLNVSVDTFRERGLLGVTLDPDFSNNHYVYVYYSRSSQPVTNRVSRFTESSTNPDVADSSSELILLDNIPSDSGIHNAGAVHFGTDGKLYITVGDSGTSSNSQTLSNLAGKILRINKDGTIPADNPFVGQAGTRGEIWAYGLRNPFTFGVNPNNGTIYINDVGEGSWEEIDQATKGANYGWPTCEGACSNASFLNPVYTYNHGVGRAIAGGAFYTGNQFPSDYLNTYFFGDYVDNFIKRLDPSTGTVTDFATGLFSPVDLHMGADGSLYYVSISKGTIYKISYTGGVSPTPDISPSVTPTANGGTGLFGSYYNTRDLTETPITRTDPTVNFDWGSGSPMSGIGSDNFSVRWTGQIMPQYSESYTFYTRSDDGVRLWINNQLVIDKWVDQPATEVSGTISLTAGQKYNIRMEYYENGGQAIAQLSWSSPSTPKQIIPQSQLFPSTNQPPTALINAPVDKSTYNAGDTIHYAGTGTDPEDGTLPDSAYSWTMIFHHDTHTHPFLGPINGVKSGDFQIPTDGEVSANTWYEIKLTVIDSQGASQTVSKNIYPNKATISFVTNPSGLQINLDGQPKTTPYSVDGVVGFKRTIEAPQQTVNGKTYVFDSWSDGGTASHTITTPATNTTYTATFKETTTTASGSIINMYAAGTPSDGVYPNMQLLINDSVVQTFSGVQGDPNSRIFQKFSYTAPITVTPEQVKIKFINDQYGGPNNDRNLRVDRIEIDGLSYETEASTTYSDGSWASADGCAPGYKQSEWLQCNGYFLYGSTPPIGSGSPTATPTPPATSGSTVTIYAAGQPGNSIYPTMQLQIDNATVSTFTDVRGNPAARTFQQFVYNSPTTVSIGQVKVLFTNDDYFGPGNDRNLMVDKVDIDGLSYETESPTVYSLGSWDAGTGCSGGKKSSEWLHCNGYFQYQ